jgi:YcaO-like protein with predicted kinase domain
VPITRVYDATALDRLGLPVWAAVTPLARDLTVHAGRGANPAQARVSAIMEAIERVCAQEVGSGRLRRASYEDLLAVGSEEVLDPAACDLPFETAYAPEQECDWVLGHELVSGSATWVALDLVISPAREGICRGVETNGLGAGDTEVEAILHGLLEVVERDAAAHDRFSRRHAEDARYPELKLIDPETLPSVPRRVFDRLRAADLEVAIEDLRHDLGIPVYRAVLTDPAFPGRDGALTRFHGLGCDLDGTVAVTGALTEAAQAHTGMFVGARDTFEGDEAAPIGLDRFLQRLAGSSSVRAFATDAEPLPDDPHERLARVLEKLGRAGLGRVVVVDLTRPDLGVPVVRVIVPGAAAPFGESARRPGWRLLRMLAP